MKNINSFLTENQQSHLWSECQNEAYDNYEYHTYALDEGQKKFNKGLLCINSDNEFVCVIGYNDGEDLINLVDDDNLHEADALKIGQSVNRHGEIIIRIW